MYVLDAYALLAFFLDEPPAADRVETWLESADRGEENLVVSRMNAAEVFYIVAKRTTESRARGIRHRMAGMPIDFVTPHDRAIWRAAELKARYPISFADAFAAALALGRRSTLATGDDEFEALEEGEDLKVEWLG